MEQKKNPDVKRLVLLAIFTALAFIVASLPQIPVVAFLKYEAKDVIITMCGFIIGPIASLIVSVISAVLETISNPQSGTGPIGCLMDILSSSCYACTAAWIYKHRRTIRGAVSGLVLGSVLMVMVMLLWNWLISPLYLHTDRQTIAGMLIPVFLPFNALKALLNSALVLCLYKPLITALRKARLVKAPEGKEGGFKLGIYLLSFAVLATGILLLLVLQGKL